MASNFEMEIIDLKVCFFLSSKICIQILDINSVGFCVIFWQQFEGKCKPKIFFGRLQVTILSVSWVATDLSIIVIAQYNRNNRTLITPYWRNGWIVITKKYLPWKLMIMPSPHKRLHFRLWATHWASWRESREHLRISYLTSILIQSLTHFKKFRCCYHQDIFLFFFASFNIFWFQFTFFLCLVTSCPRWSTCTWQFCKARKSLHGLVKICDPWGFIIFISKAALGSLQSVFRSFPPILGSPK